MEGSPVYRANFVDAARSLLCLQKMMKMWEKKRLFFFIN